MNPTLMQSLLIGLLDWLPAIGILILLAEALETVLILQRFASKQAELDQKTESDHRMDWKKR